MIKIAVTGNIASGKSLIEGFLSEKGVVTLDADKIVHELLENNESIINKVAQIFSNDQVDVRERSGSINRKKVGEIVFSDKQKLRQLEEIIHPEVVKHIKQFFNENKNKKVVAVSIPLLYEIGLENLFDYVVLVVADENIRLKRLVEHRNLTEENAINRIKAQNLDRDKIKKADFVVENNGTKQDLELKAEEILDKILDEKYSE